MRGDRERRASRVAVSSSSRRGLGEQLRRDTGGLAVGVVDDIGRGRSYEALEDGLDGRFLSFASWPG